MLLLRIRDAGRRLFFVGTGLSVASITTINGLDISGGSLIKGRCFVAVTARPW